MGNTSIGNNISAYNQVNRVGGVTDANPHRLVSMLLEGALGKIATVKGLMIRNDIAKKGEVIGQVIAIVGGLKVSLNKDAGGDIAQNLDNIYEYIERQLVKANVDGNVSILDEVADLLREIKSGWELIPVEARTAPSPDLSIVS